MSDYIPLSTLNDFIFCPYSIYLHSVYMEADEDLYKAIPQTKGTIAHKGVDEKNGSTRKNDIMSLPVYSDELKISGKIDVYKQDKHLLIERKNNLKTRVRDNIQKSKEQKNIQPTKGDHKMVTCQNYVSLFYCQITSCPSDGGIS